MPVAQKSYGEVLQAAMREQLRKQIQSDPVLFPEYEPFFRGLLAESDRALAIVAFSYISEKLHQLMARVLNPEFASGNSNLFDSFAPLSTASGRLKMCAALFWISKPTYTDLNFIRKIRNHFAHDPLSSSYDVQPVVSWFNEMTPINLEIWNAVRERHGEIPTLSTRSQFHCRLALCTARLLIELSSAPLAVRMGLQPGAVEVDGWDHMPAHLKELYEAAMRVVVHVAYSAQA